MQVIFEPPSIEELDAIFQQYAVESFIAKGGMGAVYLATQTSLDRKVAIKILPHEFDEEEHTEAFAREAKAMAKVTHGNLVSVYDFGNVEDMLYIVMEFVEGATLFDLANGKAADIDEAASVITDICNGLGTAHDEGLIHRDIKPANILVNEHGQPKIVDFGLARLSHDKAVEGETIYGTPGYTAPEVLTNPRQVDHRVDLYSVGAMFFELLTGELPNVEVYKAPSTFHEDNAIFDHIVKKALRSNPALRYGSAAEIVKDIATALHKGDSGVTQNSQNNNPLLSASAAKNVAAARPAQGGLASLGGGGATPSPGGLASLGGGGATPGVSPMQHQVKTGGNNNLTLLIVLIVVTIIGFIIAQSFLAIQEKRANEPIPTKPKKPAPKNKKDQEGKDQEGKENSKDTENPENGNKGKGKKGKGKGNR